MGYTHYWNFKGKVAPKDIKDGDKKFKKAVDLSKKCLETCNGKTRYPNWGDDRYTKEEPMVLAGGNGLGKPTITDTLICFNGERKNDNWHETCYIDLNEPGWTFCKTARKPYDTAVCLALLSFKDAFGDDFEYSSDGGDEEWEYAKEIFAKAA